MTQPTVGEPHLAYQLRRLADRLANTPDRNEVQRNAERILAAGVLLWTSGQPALAKSAQWSGPWSTGAGGPRGKGGHSDPTATVALAACPDDKGRVRDQPEHRYHQRLVTAISFTADNAVDITTVINAINSHGDEPRTDTECAEHHCNASASTGPTNRPNRRGRCDACYQWLHHWLTAHPGSTWADAPAVPAEVINARSIRRQRTKVS